MQSEEKWERFFKACAATAAIASTLGLIVGGGFGLYTYYHQGAKEIRLMQYNLKKDVYYKLADAAAAVGSSTNKEDATQNATKFSTLYFGQAHILAVDSEVTSEKMAFYEKMQEELNSDNFPDNFPNENLQRAANFLSNACRKELRVEDIFSEK
jgi:hypothetical protein